MRVLQVLIVGLLTISFFSCKKDSTEKKTESIAIEEKVPVKKESHPLKTTKRKSESAIKQRVKGYQNGNYYESFKIKDFELFVESIKNDASCKVTVKTKGLKTEIDKNFEEKGELTTAFITDLKKDGYKDLIMTFKPSKKGKNVYLKAFSFNDDNHLLDVKVVGIDKLVDQGNTDALAPKDGGIVRLFYSEGEQYMYKYDLIEDDEGYILQAKKFK